MLVMKMVMKRASENVVDVEFQRITEVFVV